ncbi:hypothetical protein A2V71_01505 [Candidatus Berkelbacteria bacterium RBG_13_40_8]|uniref:Uncharacterized protein n=1 Tax=Candidatus Berkelbacteria bacterium RBG_13_40_8 TaxID=1797467 RepID=A0A1F5DP09_9BACT|nr:MAG: hypothetical protein A2V71_01505 [Candidatus Berkelbacteria bacterium RBG_13_40_8]
MDNSGLAGPITAATNAQKAINVAAAKVRIAQRAILIALVIFFPPSLRVRVNALDALERKKDVLFQLLYLIRTGRGIPPYFYGGEIPKPLQAGTVFVGERLTPKF